MDFPLVSVAVITYNSAKTIIETLESVATQSYQCLELIISDDYSTDDTCKIASEWIEKHKERFVRTQIIRSKKNTGVAANVNRGIDACKGEWLKLHAGDDILLPNCIEEYVNYIRRNPDSEIIFSRLIAFDADDEYIKLIENRFNYDFFSWTPQVQYQTLTLKENCLPAPTHFRRTTFSKKEIKYDERVPMLEDWTMWINLLKAGIKFSFLDKTLVKYRVSAGISTNKKIDPELEKKIAKTEAYFFIFYRFKPKFKYTTGISNRLSLIQEYIHAKKIVSKSIFWTFLEAIFKFKQIRPYYRILKLRILNKNISHKEKVL